MLRGLLRRSRHIAKVRLVDIPTGKVRWEEIFRGSALALCTTRYWRR